MPPLNQDEIKVSTPGQSPLPRMVGGIIAVILFVSACSVVGIEIYKNRTSPFFASSVDGSTFRTNNTHVYFGPYDKILPKADPNNFQVLDDGKSTFAISGNYVFFGNRMLPLVDDKTFSIFKMSANARIAAPYGKDAMRAYFEHTIVPLADVVTFNPVLDSNGNGTRYAKDSNRVYFNGLIIPKANSLTFEPIADSSGIVSSYSKDEKYVYYENMIVFGADITSFKVLQATPYGESKIREDEAEDARTKYSSGWPLGQN